jgi:ribose-phosphate pyrophosphokinase
MLVVSTGRSHCYRIFVFFNLFFLRAKQFREALSKKHEVDCGLAMIVKQRAKANEIEKMDLVGSVDGCDAIIVDDMVDTAGTLCKAAEILKEGGARRVFAFCSHGVLSGPAAGRISNSVLTELVILDTIPLSDGAMVRTVLFVSFFDFLISFFVGHWKNHSVIGWTFISSSHL